jgi:hypothetical protein
MFSGSNTGPNLTNTVEISAAYIYLTPKGGGEPKELNELFVSNDDIKDKFYSKIEVDSSLALKANSTDVYSKTEVYNKTETYNKTEIDASIALLPLTSTTYTKTQVDSSLALKANVADVYNKTENDASLALKANAADVYTKIENEASLALKANVGDVYTKTENDASLALKANNADVYTKTQNDASLALKANANNAVFTNLIQGQSAYFSGNVSMASLLSLENNLKCCRNLLF